MKQKKMQHPTDSELEILQILWEKGSATVREVHDVLEKVKDTGYTTTLKTMQIMAEKRLLGRDTSSRTHVYAPRITRQHIQEQYLNKMINGLFEGSAGRLVIGALDRENLSPGEIREIREYLRQCEKNKRKKTVTMAGLVFALGSIALLSPAMTTSMFTPHGSNGLPPFGIYDHADIPPLHEPALAERAEEEPLSDVHREGEREPRTIHLHDGSTLEVGGLSKEEKEKIRLALDEVRLAMHEVNKEFFAYLRSDAFRQEMQEAGKEAAKAGEEMRKAMEELRQTMEDEEFKKEMRDAREQIRQAMKELDAVDWDAIGREVDAAMREVSAAMDATGKTLGHIGPVINEVMQQVGRGLETLGNGLLDELGPAIHNIMQSVQESIEKEAAAMEEAEKGKEPGKE